MTIRAVSFDAGGTLFKTIASVGEIYTAVAARHGCRAEAEDIQERFAIAWASRSGVVAGTDPAATSPSFGGSPGGVATPSGERAWWKGLVREVFADAGAFVDFDAFFDELHALFAEPEVWRLFPEVPQTLQRLRRDGLRLAIVSNWDSRLDALTRTLGIREQFDVVIASGEAGVSKPDPRIFELALDRLGLRAEEMLHVGDSLRDDVWGARRAGVRPLWLRRAEGRTSDPAGREFEDVMQRGVETVDALDALLPRVLT